jgi:DNA-binding IclR family transcriptional regulator
MTVMRKGALDTPSVQSVDRALAILEMVARSAEPVALGQLTALLAIDPSNVFRLANTLKRRGFLANPNGRKTYVLGPSIWRLSRKYDWSRMLINICHERVKALAERTAETSHLAVREGRQAFFIDHHASTRQSIVVSGQTGEFVPLYCTAHGKALLADFGVAELTALYGSDRLEKHTPRTIVSVKQLAKACALIRANRYAIDDGEYLDEVRCLAAPIRDKEGMVLASIGISAPATRFPKERDESFARHVTEVAEDIRAALGGESQIRTEGPGFSRTGADPVERRRARSMSSRSG